MDKTKQVLYLVRDGAVTLIVHVSTGRLEGWTREGVFRVFRKIAGYSDVVTNGVDGILVPPADPQALAEELQLLAHEPERMRAMGEAGRKSADRYSWPRIAEEVTGVYERAIEPAPTPIWQPEQFARRTGLVRIDGGPKRPAKRLPSLEPAPTVGPGRGRRAARKAGVAVAGALGLLLTALAARRIGVDRVATSIIDSDLKWVLIACVLMVGAMFARAASWVAITRVSTYCIAPVGESAAERCAHSGLRERSRALARTPAYNSVVMSVAAMSPPPR